MQKKLILSGIVVTCLLCASASANAQPHIALFTDAQGTSCSTYHTPGGTQFEVYVLLFFMGTGEGIICADFRLITPGNVIIEALEINPGYASAAGNPLDATGIDFCFLECAMGYVSNWAYKLTCRTTDGRASYFSCGPREGSEQMNAAVCSAPEGPRELLHGYIGVAVNADCVATEESSWGAIKGMYK